MKNLEDTCLRCDICINCDNKKPTIYYSCDVCGETDGFEEIYNYNEHDYCASCLAKVLLSEHTVETSRDYYGDELS